MTTESNKNEIIQDLKLVLDISSRVDERVKMIAESQHDLSQRLNRVIESHNELSSKVRVMESQTGQRLMEDLEDIRRRLDALSANSITDKMETRHKIDQLEKNKDNLTERLKHYGGLVIQALWVVIVTYILFKLGLKG